MINEQWQNFVNSGKINDYLKYKEQEHKQENESIDKGFGNQGTDGWRE